MKANKIIQALGGVGNIEKIGKDATRLKVWVKDMGLFNQHSDVFKRGTTLIRGNFIQIILGEEVERVFIYIVGKADDTTRIHIEGASRPKTPKNRTRRELEEFKVTVKLSLFVGGVVGIIIGIFLDKLFL